MRYDLQHNSNIAMSVDRGFVFEFVEHRFIHLTD